MRSEPEKQIKQGEMPELPVPAGPDVGWYTSDQMHDYGRACADAARKDERRRIANWCDSQARSDWYGHTAGDMVRLYAALRERLGEKKE